MLFENIKKLVEYGIQDVYKRQRKYCTQQSHKKSLRRNNKRMEISIRG